MAEAIFYSMEILKSQIGRKSMAIFNMFPTH